MYLPPMELDRLTKPQRVAAACMVVVAVAAFLPWVSIFGIGVLGIEGDGQVTLVCAIIGLIVLALRTRRSDGEQPVALRVVAYVAAVIAVFIGLADMNGAAAIGLYLTLFGALGWLASLVWDGVERRRAAGPSPATDVTS